MKVARALLWTVLGSFLCFVAAIGRSDELWPYYADDVSGPALLFLLLALLAGGLEVRLHRRASTWAATLWSAAALATVAVASLLSPGPRGAEGVPIPWPLFARYAVLAGAGVWQARRGGREGALPTERPALRRGVTAALVLAVLGLVLPRTLITLADTQTATMTRAQSVMAADERNRRLIALELAGAWDGPSALYRVAALSPIWGTRAGCREAANASLRGRAAAETGRPELALRAYDRCVELSCEAVWRAMGNREGLSDGCARERAGIRLLAEQGLPLSRETVWVVDAAQGGVGAPAESTVLVGRSAVFLADGRLDVGEGSPGEIEAALTPRLGSARASRDAEAAELGTERPRDLLVVFHDERPHATVAAVLRAARASGYASVTLPPEPRSAPSPLRRLRIDREIACAPAEQPRSGERAAPAVRIAADGYRVRASDGETRGLPLTPIEGDRVHDVATLRAWVNHAMDGAEPPASICLGAEPEIPWATFRRTLDVVGDFDGAPTRLSRRSIRVVYQDR